MVYAPDSPDIQSYSTTTEQTAQTAETGTNISLTGHGGDGALQGGRPAIVRESATLLDTVAAGIAGAVSPRQFMQDINACHKRMGNRAFVRWARKLHSRNLEPDRVAVADPLQLMPKKKKKSGQSTSAEQSETGAVGAPGTDVETPPASGATLSEAATKMPLSLPEAAEAGGKNKKKTKAQMALNKLRTDSVESFRCYVEEEISSKDSLRRIRDRIIRGEDPHGDRRVEALKVINARLQVLDPEADLFSPAMAGTVEDRKEPVRAKVKTSMSKREGELFNCCQRGNVVKLRDMLRFGTVDINMAIDGGTLLCYASYNGNAAVVNELLSKPGIDVNLATQDGVTPLFLAAQQGHASVVRLLLKARGIDVNLVEQFGSSPLCIAVQSGREEIVELLLATPNIKINIHSDDGGTPLVLAIQQGFPRIVELLVKHGADINLVTLNGFTPLCVAAGHGRIEIIRILLRASNIHVNHVREDGVTALSLACARGHKDIVKLLLRKKADPKIGHKSGLTPLHVSSLHGYTGIAEMLLHAGADLDAEAIDDNESKYTPLDLAKIVDNRVLISLFDRYRQKKIKQSAQVERLSGEVEPGLTPPPVTASHETPALPASTPSSKPEKSDTTPHAAEIPSPATVEQPASASPGVSREPPSETLPDVPQAKTRSTLDSAKDELIQELLRKLGQNILEPLEGIRLMSEVRSAESLDSLCRLYNRIASMERHKERARRSKSRGRVSRTGAQAMAKPPASVFVLGNKLDMGLDAEAVEEVIKQYLDQIHHRFVSQAVNDMEFGRGKPTTDDYPGLLHASAGIAGVGSCSVFYYFHAEQNLIRIVGIGRHVGPAAYELVYAAEGLDKRGRILRIA